MIRKHLGRLTVDMMAFNPTVLHSTSVEERQHGQEESRTDAPIKQVVVILEENVSFDHYFGTYPKATNPSGEPSFHARPCTPTVNGLMPALLTSNPNGFNPFRLDRSQALTCEENHDYEPEQVAYALNLIAGLTGPADLAHSIGDRSHDLAKEVLQRAGRPSSVMPILSMTIGAARAR